jgi:membrane-associated protease RseP (regulator of RpoE activity)
MPFISYSLYIAISVVTGVAGLTFAILLIYLESNLNYMVRKLLPSERKRGGSPPKRKPTPIVWVIFWTSGAIGVIGTVTVSSVRPGAGPSTSTPIPFSTQSLVTNPTKEDVALTVTPGAADAAKICKIVSPIGMAGVQKLPSIVHKDDLVGVLFNGATIEVEATVPSIPAPYYQISSLQQPVYLSKVEPNSLGAEKGLQEYDIIQKVDDLVIENLNSMNEYLNGRSGQSVVLTIRRLIPEKHELKINVVFPNQSENWYKYLGIDIAGGERREVEGYVAAIFVACSE